MTLEQEKKHKELMRRSKQNIMDAQRVVRQARELVRSSRRKSRPSPLLSGVVDRSFNHTKCSPRLNRQSHVRSDLGYG